MLPKSKHIWRPSFCTEGVNQNIIALADDNLTKTLEPIAVEDIKINISGESCFTESPGHGFETASP